MFAYAGGGNWKSLMRTGFLLAGWRENGDHYGDLRVGPGRGAVGEPCGWRRLS